MQVYENVTFRGTFKMISEENLGYKTTKNSLAYTKIKEVMTCLTSAFICGVEKCV